MDVRLTRNILLCQGFRDGFLPARRTSTLGGGRRRINVPKGIILRIATWGVYSKTVLLLKLTWFVLFPAVAGYQKKPRFKSGQGDKISWNTKLNHFLNNNHWSILYNPILNNTIGRLLYVRNVSYHKPTKIKKKLSIIEFSTPEPADSINIKSNLDQRAVIALEKIAFTQTYYVPFNWDNYIFLYINCKFRINIF